jgi:hypothetical protein
LLLPVRAIAVASGDGAALIVLTTFEMAGIAWLRGLTGVVMGPFIAGLFASAGLPLSGSVTPE